MKGIMRLVKNMEKENISGQAKIISLVNGQTTKLMVMANIFGVTADCIKGIGRTIICMGKVCINGLMEESMRANILTIKSRFIKTIYKFRVLENIAGQTNDITKEIGKMANSMAKADMPWRMVLTE
jgi:hypothetical protein